MKIRFIAAHALTISLLITASVSQPIAASKIVTTTVTKEFTTKDENFSYNFEKKIKKDGIVYKLSDTSYEKKEEKIITKQQPVTQTVNVSNLTKKDAKLSKTKIFKNKDGQEVQMNLKEIKYTKKNSEHKATVKSTKNYGYQTQKPNPEKTMVAKVKNENINKNVDANFTLTNLKKGSTKWVQDEEFSITVEDYGSEKYNFAGKEIKLNSSSPLHGEENTILKQLGLSSKEYKINSISWDGESYKKGNKTYRNATAYASRKAAQYVATYTATVTTTIPTYDAIATYEGMETVDSGKKEYKVIGTATYSTTVQESVKNTVKEKPTKKSSVDKYVMITLGIIILIILVVSVLYTLSKNKEKNQKTDNKK